MERFDGLKVFWPLLKADAAPPLADSLLLGWFLTEESLRPQNAVVTLLSTQSGKTVAPPKVSYLNVVVAAFVPLTETELRENDISSLLRCTQVSQYFEEGRTLEAVGLLTVDGSKPTRTLRKVMMDQRVRRNREGREFCPWWAEFRAGGLTEGRTDSSRWPRIESLFRWTCTVGSPMAQRLQRRVHCQGTCDVIFYKYPYDVFYYASSQANTVGLLRTVASDVKAFRRRREIQPPRDGSPAGVPHEAFKDDEPFEQILRQLNLSAYVAEAATMWRRPESDTPEDLQSPMSLTDVRTPESISVINEDPRPPREWISTRLRRRAAASRMMSCPDPMGGRLSRDEEERRYQSTAWSAELAGPSRVTPEGRALPTPLTWKRFLWVNLLAACRLLIVPILILLSVLGSLICRVLRLNRPGLSDDQRAPFSLFFAQTLIRIRVVSQWPGIWLRMRELRRQHESRLPRLHDLQDTPPKRKMGAIAALRLRLGYNTLLLSSASLIFLDLALGWTLGYLLMKYPDTVLWGLHRAYNFLHIDVLRAQVDWLMGFPAGLKLNDRLSFFIGELLLTAIDTWNELTTQLAPMEPLVLSIVAKLSFFGASFLVAATLDILAFCTLHVFYIYVFISEHTRITLRCLQSLSYLFRGRKWNVLRRRVDSCEYHVDQLLIGSVAFTCLLLLLPTILVFYSSFVFTWLIILCTQLLLQFIMAVLNHFPLYLLMLRLTSSMCLPSGVTIQALPDSSGEMSAGGLQMCYWILEATSVSINNSVVKPFTVGLQLQFASFNPWSIVKSVLTGQIIHLHGSLSMLFQLMPGLGRETTITKPRAESEVALSNILKPFNEGDDDAPEDTTPFFPFVFADFPVATFRELLELVLDGFTGSKALADELIIRKAAHS